HLKDIVFKQPIDMFSHNTTPISTTATTTTTTTTPTASTTTTTTTTTTTFDSKRDHRVHGINNANIQNHIFLQDNKANSTRH
ncbi:hypothetical protein MGE_03733, partial [Candida albicans P75010]